MKKTVMAFTVLVLLAGCSGSGSSSNSGKDTSYKDINGVVNVNGNIPDTNATGATPHTDSLPKDSVTKGKMDSMRRK